MITIIKIMPGENHDQNLQKVKMINKNKPLKLIDTPINERTMIMNDYNN